MKDICKVYLTAFCPYGQLRLTSVGLHINKTWYLILSIFFIFFVDITICKYTNYWLLQCTLHDVVPWPRLSIIFTPLPGAGQKCQHCPALLPRTPHPLWLRSCCWEVVQVSRPVQTHRGETWRIELQMNLRSAKISQLQRRPLLGHSPSWKHLLVLSHSKHY